MSFTSSKQSKAVASLALLMLATTGLPACQRRRHAAVPDEADPALAEDDKPDEAPITLSKPPAPAIPGMTRASSVPSLGSERVLRGDADLGSIERVGGTGVVDVGAVARVLRGQLGGMRACYERELRNTPALAGRLEMNFTIDQGGRITGAFPVGLDAAPTVGTCVISRLSGLVFPASQGGDVVFRQPITFTPGS